jgi:hypothetical protein
MTWNPGLSRIHFCRGGRSGEGRKRSSRRAVLASLNSTLSVGVRQFGLPTANPHGFIVPRRLPRSVCYEPTKNSSEPRLAACGSPRRPPRSVSEAESSKGRATAEMLSSKRAQSNTISLVLRKTSLTPGRWLSRSSCRSRSGGRDFIRARENVPRKAWGASVILATRHS